MTSDVWPTDQSPKEHFARLFGQMKDPAFLVESLTGRILACNQAAAREFRCEMEELVGRDFGSDLSSGDFDFRSEGVAAQLSAGQTSRFVHQKRRLDGSIFWDEVVLVPYWSGEHPIHISMNRNISDRVEREQALRDSEERYRSIFQSTTDAIFIFDRDGVVVEANPNAYQMYGYDEGELIGLPAREIIHPDYYHGFANYRGAIDKDGHFIARSINRRKDGSEFDVEVHGGRFVYEGSPHLLSIVRDVREQVKAEKELEEGRRKLEQLHDAANRLEACDQETEIYRITIDAAQAILDLSICSLDIVEGARLVVKATSSGVDEHESVETGLDQDNLAVRTLRTQKTTVFGAPDEVPGITPTTARFHSGISTPIGPFGVFQVASETRNAFSEEDVRLLELILGHTAQAIRRIRLQDELVMQANHDPLTGLYNRRYFNQVIEGELSRSSRYDHPLAFLMIDVNRFKEINDRFGHQMGDDVLQAVGVLLQEAVRESDLVVRYGGDEFLIVLLEASEGVETVTHRIEDAVAERNRTNHLIPFPVSLAIGSAYWLPSSDVPLETVLAEADQRMYAEKRRLSEQDRPGS